ncbi:zwei Ig domain protein zig-8-like isoform X2 [Tigriopus californicus]|uniref:zwei Ig domain protein zig-8-like isoform X2 n=1 Tax=Tigriopus californicus TaxID=6832 RepID=UPI0027D9DE80|nr:zwei Ig domain protein zig-8-like isoform X2 [Tigriopus californicus]
MALPHSILSRSQLWASPSKVMTAPGSLALLLWILLLPTLISSENEANSKRDRSSYDPPFLFGDAPGNTTVQVGGTAYLHCPVFNLGERQLTWIRRRDWHILTHGAVTFTTDDRFQLVKEEHVDDWVLQIKHVVARDTGSYECQVTADSGIRSRRVDLKVVTPEAFILADEEYHIDRGSSLSLVCIIEKATTPPQYVFWYHNERMINYDSERGISVTTTPGRKTHSQLFIQKADISDSGNYTCEPSSSIPASIQVFVSGSEVKPWVTSGSMLIQGGFLSLFAGLLVFHTTCQELLVLTSISFSSHTRSILLKAPHSPSTIVF